MNMKNKLKKGYCIFSLILATFAICVSVWYASGSTVYASSYGATDNAPNSSDWVTGKGGVSFDHGFRFRIFLLQMCVFYWS